MKINLERLEELKIELHGQAGPDYGNQEPLGLQIILEALRGYMYNHNEEDGVIFKLLSDYGVLVNETNEESPVVKPHRFTENG
tara:strand:+ start:362 stop:610 length:249 start_codon:yes stop_codon:yes gene_type:complete